MSEESNQNSGNTEPASENPAAKELEETKKKYLYLAADFDNFRKQTIKERSDLMKYGSEPLLREMLHILDDVERAAEMEAKEAQGAESFQTLKKGVLLISEQFKKSLARFGVEPVDSLGALFDPMQHEALSQEENPNYPPNVVSRVFKKAYKLHGKLIRPAQVVVNVAKPTKSEPPAQ